jgi:atlastin
MFATRILSDIYQVVSINAETHEIVVDRDALSLISENIRRTGVEDIAIVSIMGAYRTGKSFLLDLFLRFLRYREASVNSATPMEANESEIPDWLLYEGEHIDEGTSNKLSRIGFEWRGGMDKVTEGIWLWSKPFVLETEVFLDDGSKSVRKVSVLLLDSQGAFDSKMSKDQSATIFGLTAVLSSLQIYNISKQLQEDAIENLHYFMECAGSCVRYLQQDDSETNPAVFQNLQFLVRDWANFGPDWSIEMCEDQMRAHLAQHLDAARDSATPKALKTMFSDISIWSLPHPGLHVNRPSWNGRISDLEPDFVRLLDAYVKRVFSSSLQNRIILGKSLTPSTFVDVVATFVEAFADLVPKGANLATALAKTTNLLSKEQCITDYRTAIEKAIDSNNRKGLPEEDLDKIQKETKSYVLESFRKSTRFGPVEDRDAVCNEMIAELDRLDKVFVVENRRRMESALTVFAGLCVVILLLYGLDKLSDVTCDWYSQACVRISNALLMVYSLLSIAILTNIYLLFQSRGKTVALMAVLEMGKAVIALFMSLIDSTKNIYKDLKASDFAHLRSDTLAMWNQLVREIRQGITEMVSSLKPLKP